jgi:hypothetical protein
MVLPEKVETASSVSPRKTCGMLETPNPVPSMTKSPPWGEAEAMRGRFLPSSARAAAASRTEQTRWNAKRGAVMGFSFFAN